MRVDPDAELERDRAIEGKQRHHGMGRGRGPSGVRAKRREQTATLLRPRKLLRRLHVAPSGALELSRRSNFALLAVVLDVKLV